MLLETLSILLPFIFSVIYFLVTSLYTVFTSVRNNSFFALLNISSTFGRTNITNNASIAITASNSTKVKPFLFISLTSILQDYTIKKILFQVSLLIKFFNLIIIKYK